MEFIDLQAQRDRIGDKIDNAIARVLEHGKFVMGPEVAELEHRLAERVGANHAVSCASGTDALLMPLMAFGTGPSDAVLCPTFTFTATAEVIALLGATPVFVDSLRDTFNMDPDQLAPAADAARAAGLRPVGVVAVDLFGLPADYERVESFAAAEGLWVLADAAQSFGARVGDVPVGRFGRATSTSFFPAKPLGCYGDGGAIFTDDDDLAAVLRSIRVHGQGTHKYENVRVGINGRLDTIQAAVLLEKLAVFDDEFEARQRVASRYAELLGDVVRVPAVPDDRLSAWAQYTVVVDRRDELAAALRESGVPTAVYYPRPLHQQPAYQRGVCAGAPVAESLSASVLSLPMHPYLDENEQDLVVDAIRVKVAELGI
ncbi:MAG TPA: DegT/DnrJ/EryC1/StrS family aminotransferase [Acidimicrobiales bacterium]|nr:DegT/DnrJ/EryC1/StrS family aminotransferase [Acidimicrobiales bacterium]